jgi:thermitase
MPEHERFYYADGEKVPLRTSERLVAVQTADDDAAAAVAGIANSIPVGPAPVPVLDLPDHGLAVVAVPPDGQEEPGAMAARVRESVAAAPELETGPPVYETAQPGAEALIPLGEVIVKFREGADRAALLRKRKLTVKQEDYPEPGAVLATVPDGADAVDVANALHEAPDVEYAEPNFVIVTPRVAAITAPADRNGEQRLAIGAPAFTPTDPGFASQWGLKKIRAPEAWDITRGSASIAVAVLDEGCDVTHEDLDYKTPGYDAYDRDDDPTPQATDGHGTSCAGVAAAKAGNARGGVGVAPACKVLPIRIAKGTGGGFWDTTSAMVADGIRKAVDRGADVLSNSYGVAPSTAVTNAFNYAQTNGRGGRGCPSAAATGNDDRLGIIYPARLSPNIRGFVAVGASNEWDQRKSKTSLDGESWWGSNYGPEVDVVAPGVHIYTTDIMGANGYGPGNYVPDFNGTSSATPHVAGLMALILSVDPALRAWEVEDIVKMTAQDLGTGGRDQQFGFGRIDARRALEAASKIWYEVTVGLEFLGSGRECYMRLNARMYNPGINTVRLDSVTLTSHNAAGTAEIDRFEYRPNPGNVLAPRSGQDVRLNRVLLKANGNQASHSYRWNINWTYTFWRPSAPNLPLGASEPTDVAGTTATGSVSGGGEAGAAGRLDSEPAAELGLDLSGDGDRLTLDRERRKLTIELNL